MSNILKTGVLIIFTFFFIYSCNDSGPTIDNSNNSGNHAPAAPNNPFPHNDTTGVPRLLTVSWTCEDPDAGDTIKYDVYMANDNPPVNVLITNLLANSYFVPFLLDTSRVYYWRVNSKDNHGAITTGTVWKFTTGLTD